MVTRLVFLVTSRARQLVLLKVKETRPLYPLFFSLSFSFSLARLYPIHIFPSLSFYHQHEVVCTRFFVGRIVRHVGPG